MKVRRASGRAVVALLVPVILAAAVGWVNTSSATSTSTASSVAPAGTLRLELEPGTSRFAFTPAAGAPYTLQTQAVATQPGTCRLPTGGAASPNLARLTGFEGSTSRPVGYVDFGLGVQGAKDGSGKPCGRVSSGTEQSLKLELTGYVEEFVITEAKLDVEGKFGSRETPATITVTLFEDGAKVGTSHDFDCSTTGGTSDCGPDSGGADNFDILIGGAGGWDPGVHFDAIELTAKTGSFSLEGGSDTPDGTELQLAAPALPCDEPVTETADGTSATVTLLSGGTAGCDLAYILDIRNAREVFFDVAKGPGTEAQFLVEIDWGTMSEERARATTEIDLDPGDASEGEEAVYCVDPQTTDGRTTYSHPTATTTPWWCQVDGSQEVVPGGVHVVETFFGKGDPLFLR